MKVFFDTNIFSASRSYENVVSRGTIQWGDIELQTEEHSIQRKNSDNPEHQALIDIGVYGRSGAFSANRTQSIMLETFPQSRIAINTDADALRGIEIETHPDIIDLSCFRTFTFADDLMKIKRSMTEAIGLVKSLKEKNLEEVFQILKIKKTFADFSNSVEKVANITKKFDEKHWPDAFHYTSADHNGGDIFLTCDRKFVNFVRDTVKYEISCVVLLPTELLEKLKTSTH